MRWEKTGFRDLTYNTWHRDVFPDDFGFIDIDQVSYCKKCNKILALVETAVDVGQKYKCAKITSDIAKKLDVLCFVLLYKKDSDNNIIGFRLRYTNPNCGYFWQDLTVEEYKILMNNLFDKHKGQCIK